jgi:hypothetical protein
MDGATTESELIVKLRHLSREDGRIVRLYYLTPACDYSGGPLDPLQLTLQEGGRGDQSGRSILSSLAQSTRVDIKEEADAIRILIDAPPVSVLSTRIQSLQLSDHQRRTPDLIIGGIENSPEMRESVNREGLSFALVAGNWPHSRSARARPLSIPQNATADHILDGLAKHFGGIVTYSVCSDQREINIRYFSLNN